VATIKVGDKAPVFSLKDDQGKTVRLADYKGKTLVIYFYPKDDTPGCTVEACSFRDNVGSLRKLGAEVVGVSKDPVLSHGKFRDKFNLSFPLLADEDITMSKAYGVYQEKSMYGKKYWGVARNTFIVGSDGTILKVYDKVKPDEHVQEVTDFLKTL
jgi:thioredoxin-dependent peroxiredoxin